MLELHVIKFLLEPEGGEYLQHLSRHMFSGEITRYMFTSIQGVKDRTGKVPSLDELKILLYQRFEEGDQKKTIRRYLRTVKEAEVSNEFVGDLVGNIVQKSQLRQLFQKYVPSLDSMDPIDMSVFRMEVNKIMDKGIGAFDLVELDVHERRDWKNEGAMVPTFSSKLNELLLGGLTYGELGLIQANPGIGKTLTCINLAVAGAITGHQVWFVTLDEMAVDIATRFDYRLATYRGKRAWTKNIKLIDFSSGASLSDLEVLVDTNGKPDLIIVDGTDDFQITEQKGLEIRGRIAEIYKGLRRLSRRKEGPIPIWVTSQSTAASEGKTKKGMFDVTDNKIVKAGESSIVLSINQSEEEAQENVARLFLAKARRPCGPGHTIRLIHERETQSLKDLDDTDEEVIQNLSDTKRRRSK